MARRSKKTAAEAANDQPEILSSNGIDPDVMQSIIAEIEAEWDNLEKLRAEYMNKCKGPRAAIAEIKAAAKDQHGIGSKALSAYLQDHADLRKIVKREKKRINDGGGLESEVEQIRLAAGQLADLPFGDWLTKQVS